MSSEITHVDHSKLDSDLSNANIFTYNNLDDVDDAATLLSYILRKASQAGQPFLTKYSDVTLCLNLLNKDTELLEILKTSHKLKQYERVRNYPIFQTENYGSANVMTIPGDIQGQHTATEQSWQREFIGNAAHALWEHICQHYNSENDQLYAHYAAIVQSSGMGKSRTVDELGKLHFVIPMNLRGKDTSGYPPADHQVRDFLAHGGSKIDVYHRACAFLDALFERTATVLQTEFNDVGYLDLPTEFRDKMTSGQALVAAGPYRKKFYDQVVNKANTLFDTMQSENKQKDVLVYAEPKRDERIGYYFPAANSLQMLVACLNPNRANSPCPPSGSMTSDERQHKTPLVILAFDEAHVLTTVQNGVLWSNFSELRHALRGLNRLPCFSLFLSTTGKISQFTPSKDDDVSLRVVDGDLTLIQPFTDIGFDALAIKISLSNNWTLEAVSSISHMAHYGRPLFGSRFDAGDTAVRQEIIKFAAAKLLNSRDPTKILELNNEQILACLSQRIPLEFKSTTYASQQTSERKQVEGHMRVCLKIDAAFESMVTVSASEPLLAEAAYYAIANCTVDIPKSMKLVLEGFSTDRGDRGEFLVLTMLTIARDLIVGPPDQDGAPKDRVFPVTSFLSEHLFRGHQELNALRDDFPNAKMHFNHYIKVHECKVISAKNLLLLAGRGAAVLCATNQQAIDGINPFLRSGSLLSENNLGLILWQVKADKSFTHKPQPDMFCTMNPYRVEILKEGEAAVPIIKIIFALAAKQPSLNVIRHPPSADYNAVVYDIWCSGLSSKFLTPIKPNQEGTWEALLQASRSWESIYKAEATCAQMRRSMNPGAACHKDHWFRWVEEEQPQPSVDNQTGPMAKRSHPSPLPADATKRSRIKGGQMTKDESCEGPDATTSVPQSPPPRKRDTRASRSEPRQYRKLRAK